MFVGSNKGLMGHGIFLTNRSSQRRCSIKKGVLKNFATFTGKHQRLFFITVAGLRPATLLKKRLGHKCFPVNLAKFLRIPFLQNTSGRLLLTKNFFLTLRRFFEHYLVFASSQKLPVAFRSHD